jgi:hypothetical protein
MTLATHRASVHCFYRSLVLLLTPLFLLISMSPALAEEDLELINRPVNMIGLTGLIFTTTPYTLQAKTVELSAGSISENSTIPNIAVNEMPVVSVTVGLSHNMELAIKDSYIHKKLNENSTQRGGGDTELSYKWNFLPQTESSLFPAAALIITGIAPTGDNDLNIGMVAHWGAKCGLSLGREITWSDHVIGAYFDGQMVTHDPSDDRFRDTYGMLNMGLLYPISKYRNLQLIIEYNVVNGINRISDVGGDYVGVTYGLRMVAERINLTIGAQFLRSGVEGFDNSSRVIGMGSIKF